MADDEEDSKGGEPKKKKKEKKEKKDKKDKKAKRSEGELVELIDTSDRAAAAAPTAMTLPTHRPLSADDSMTIEFDTMAASQNENHVAVSLVFCNNSAQHISKLELSVIESMNAKVVGLSGDSIVLPFQLGAGVYARLPARQWLIYSYYYYYYLKKTFR